MEKRDDLRLAMREFIKSCEKAGYHKETVSCMGIILTQKEITAKTGSKEKTFLHFADLVKKGMSEQELIDLACEMAGV